MLGVLMAGALLTGCSGGGQVEWSNEGTATVLLDLGHDDTVEVTADGGGALFTDDCLDGPVRVTFQDGRVVELGGPVCPGQQVRVGDGTAEVGTAPTGG